MYNLVFYHMRLYNCEGVKQGYNNILYVSVRDTVIEKQRNENVSFFASYFIY